MLCIICTRIADVSPDAASYLHWERRRLAGHGSCNEELICTAILGWKFGLISLLPAGRWRSQLALANNMRHSA
jgi:hypothetical protein